VEKRAHNGSAGKAFEVEPSEVLRIQAKARRCCCEDKDYARRNAPKETNFRKKTQAHGNSEDKRTI